MPPKPPARSSPSSPAACRSVDSVKQNGAKSATPASPEVARSDLLSGALEGFADGGSPASIEGNTHVILGNGWYQTRVLIAASLAAAVMLSQALVYELIGRPVDHWCSPPKDMRHLPAYEWRNAAIPIDVDGHFSQCTVYDPPFPENDTAERRVVECQEWDYDSSNRADSIVSRWDLVCGRRWLYDLSVLAYMLSAVIFVPVSGAISDRLGRRLVILMAAGALLCASVGVAIAETLPFFLTARLLVSASCNAITMIISVLLYEVVEKEQRTLYVVCGTGIGVTVPVPFLKAVGVLEPRWALANAMFVVAAALLTLLCYSLEEPNGPCSLLRKMNGTDMDKARNSVRLLRAQIRQQEVQHTTSSTGLFKSETGSMTIISRAIFRRQVASVVICFVSLTFLFYVFLFQGQLSRVYEAAAHLVIQSCIYFATCRVTGIKEERGTLTTMMLLLSLSTAAHAVAKLQDFQFAVFFLRSLVLAICSACLSVAYAYTANVCPVSIRSTGLCLAYSCGRVGGLLGVVVAKRGIERDNELAFSAIMVLLVLSSAAAIQWLPEVFIKRSPKKVKAPEAMSPEQRKEALKESIASPTRAKKSHRQRGTRSSKSRSKAASPEPVDVGSNTVKKAASPILQQKGRT
ncbi:hypothetical protein HPB50_017833 [Hyalomma asiaticum]|uniref:Uncharacterized protein n=1 Tax=Hyalomma asiaticum TaxID=266040 RepID=A0ACB7SXV7_HYAAI|nr:hypothetical protein HPB50_017833 [Hyalomma asiaticum]